MIVLSEDMQKKIEKQALIVAKHAANQVSKEEQTYWERISQKLDTVKNKAEKQVHKFTRNPATLDEAQELKDYMTQYVENLMEAEALTEEDAFARAAAEFDIPEAQSTYEEQMREYYSQFDPAYEEAVGLIYASRMLICGVIGGILGMFGQMYYNGEVVGLVLAITVFLGILLGVGLALGSQAKIVKERGKRSFGEKI